MSHDRTGERIDKDPCPNNCRNGWLSPADADVAVACPCRWKNSAPTDSNDFAERTPSPRAAAAIQAEKDNNR